MQEPLDINFQIVDVLLGLGDRCGAAVFLVPAADSLLFFADGSLLGVNLRAGLALIRRLVPVHHELHPAGLSSAVLLGTVLPKVSPFPALAGHFVGVVEAHFGCR